ncbi:elongator complex protein 2-like [Portunus trituberculatus]|uniref:elongator complex protein 2-like n=1 Tax=Portunus trituberculatus TaxID=210409 RepID=UPI001E1D112C|nr:elongator complex protein 2-like [Portunus trituberculatus]
MTSTIEDKQDPLMMGDENSGSPMKLHTEYLSSGVNQISMGIDWNTDGIVCYAASTGVLLYDPQVHAVTGASIKHHTKRVTCVRWVHPTPTGSCMVVSGGGDGKAVLWTISQKRTEGLHVLNPLSVLDHGDSVNLVDATVVKVKEKEMILVVTASTDLISTWLVCPESETHEHLHSSAPPGNVFPLSLRLFEVSGAKFPVIVCGGHDSRIHILAARELGVYYSVCRLSGHEDWVTSLAVMKEDDGGLLLASGSKDATVRLWKLFKLQNINEPQEEQNASSVELKLKSITFEIPSLCEDISLCALLDTVLSGHEGLVSEVCWASPSFQGDKLQATYRLLTCSKMQDRSIIIWEPNEDTTSSMWLEVARLGEVGGNMEGYYSCQFSPDGSQVLGCSYQGALHLWELQDGAWEPCVVAGGHFNQVADIAWDLSSRYLLSVSKDQTTRLHAGWKANNEYLQDVHQVQNEGKDDVQAYFKPLSLSAPPTEDQLMQNTLWPEISKLYGHGNDIFTVASSSDGSILASACRAANNIDAAIILWNTTSWSKMDTLAKHRLTVTQLAFSPDDQYLLSVSRDRTWTVFMRAENNKGVTYKLQQSSTKKEDTHSRVIWSCAWLPDSIHFVTASRDKTVVVWGLVDSVWCKKAVLNENDEVTAVAATNVQTSHCVLIAIGLLSGDIHLRRYYPKKSAFSLEVTKVFHKHHDVVRRLKFRPTLESTTNVVYLASCSSDSRVNIYKINL